jgi:phosphoribosyl 1,2-cyclic phosphate phosphodiesterase
MKSKLIILGCGSSIGVPRIDGYWGNCNKNNKKNNRSRCSAAIIKGSNSILIDASPDIRQQLLSNRIKSVSSVIFTHEHADQTNGLFELRPFYWRNKEKINIYGNLKTINHLKKRQDYLFRKISDYPPIVKANLINSKFSLGKKKEKIFFRTIQLKHGKTKSIIYVFEKTAYVSDCNDLSIIKFKELKNLKYLIIDCLKLEKHPTHFNLNESLYIHDCLKPKKTILTNLHHDLDYRLLLRKLPKNVLPAYDGLSLNL